MTRKRQSQGAPWEYDDSITWQLWAILLVDIATQSYLLRGKRSLSLRGIRLFCFQLEWSFITILWCNSQHKFHKQLDTKQKHEVKPGRSDGTVLIKDFSSLGEHGWERGRKQKEKGGEGGGVRACVWESVPDNVCTRVWWGAIQQLLWVTL